MTNEEKAKEIIRKYREYVFSSRDYGIEQCLLEMAEWKDLQIAEAKELLRLCYNTILGITSLDTSEEIAKARKSHDSSLIKRIESFMSNN
jgi:hypothetical protein